MNSLENDQSILQPIMNLTLVRSEHGDKLGYALRESKTLNKLFPKEFTISPNYGDQRLNYTDGKNRLHNTEIILFFVHQNVLHCVLVTLEEAESIRRAIQQNPNAYERCCATLAILKFNSATSKNDEMTKSREKYTWDDLECSLTSSTLTKNCINSEFSALSRFICCCKMFDSFYYFSDIEVALLVELFSTNEKGEYHYSSDKLPRKKNVVNPCLMERQSFHDCLKKCRQRFDSWQTSPFAKVLTSSDSETLLRITTVTEKIKKIFSENTFLVSNLRHEFAIYDLNKNGHLDYDELMQAIESTQEKNHLDASWSKDELSSVIQNALSKSKGELTFTQFSLFFFGFIPSTVSSTNMKVNNKQSRNTAKHKESIKSQSSATIKLKMDAKYAAGGAKDETSCVESVGKAVPLCLLVRSVHSIGRLIPFPQINSGRVNGLGLQGSTFVFKGFRVATQSIEPITMVPCAICVSKGCVFFEIEIEHLVPGSEFRVGWADALFQGGLLGADENSWAISSGTCSNSPSDFNAAAWNGKYPVVFGDQWKPGDVIGCLAEYLHNNVRLRFGYNGSWISPADIVFDKIHCSHGLIPGISLGHGVVVRMNCGNYPFRFTPPCEHLNIFEVICRKQQEFLRRSVGKSECSFVAVSEEDGIQLKTNKNGITNVRWKSYVQNNCTITKAGCLVYTGKWFFEIRLKEQYGRWSFGWATLHCDFSNACGDDEFSWCFQISGAALTLRHNGKDQNKKAPSEKYKEKRSIHLKDTIFGSAVDADAGTIQFYMQRSGEAAEDLGVAFEGCTFSSGLIPVASAPCWCDYDVCDARISPLASGLESSARFEPDSHGFRPLHESLTSFESTARKDAEESIGSGKTVKSVSARVCTGINNVKVKISGDQTILLEGLNLYPSVRIDSFNLTGGRWYFEVTVKSTFHTNKLNPTEDSSDDRNAKDVSRQCLAALGWSQTNFFGSSEELKGIGDDRGSYAYCGHVVSNDGLTRGYKKIKGNLIESSSITASKLEDAQNQTIKLLAGNETVEHATLWMAGDIIGMITDFENQCFAVVHWRGNDLLVPENPSYFTKFEGIDIGTGLSPTFSLTSGFHIAVSLNDESGGFKERKGVSERALGIKPALSINKAISINSSGGIKIYSHKYSSSRSKAVTACSPRVRLTKTFSLHEAVDVTAKDKENDPCKFSIPRTLDPSALAPFTVNGGLCFPIRKTSDNLDQIVVSEVQKWELDIEINKNAELKSDWVDCMSNVLQFVSELKDKVVSLKLQGPPGDIVTMKGPYEQLNFDLQSVFHHCSLITSFHVDNFAFSWSQWGLNAIVSTIDDHKSLESLVIQRNDIGGLGATKLGHALQFNTTLTTLVLNHTKIDSAGACQLMCIWKVAHSLTTLDLSNNLMDGSAGHGIQRMLEVYPNLQKLILANNMLGYGIIAVAKGLMSNEGLTQLDLENNQVRSDEVTKLAEALKHNRTLKVLNLKKCNISVQGLEELCDLFSSCHHSITNFIFEDSKLSESQRLALLFSFNRKPMKLIYITGLISLGSESNGVGLGWKAFFQNPLAFCIWFTFFKDVLRNEKKFFHEDTKPEKILITLLIQSRNQFSNISGLKTKKYVELAGRAARDSITLTDPSLEGCLEDGSQSTVGPRCSEDHMTSLNAAVQKNGSSIKMPIVSQSDARDSLCLVISMLKEQTHYKAEVGERRMENSRQTLLWIIDQMIGEQEACGTGIVYKEKQISPANAITHSYFSPASEQKELTYVFMKSNLKKMIKKSENLHSATVGQLQDLWSCSHCERIHEIKPGIIKEYLPHASGKVTALLCALQIGRALEIKHSVAKRLLLRNQCKDCCLIDNSTKLHYAVIISESHHGIFETFDREKLGENGLVESTTNARFYQTNPDLSNVNACLKPNDFELTAETAETQWVGALALAAKNGLGEIVVLLLSLGAAHEWEIKNLEIKNLEKCMKSNILKRKKKNLPLYQDVGLLLADVCKSPPGAGDLMLSYAHDLLTQKTDENKNCVGCNDQHGVWPIHYACINGHHALVSLMISECDDFNGIAEQINQKLANCGGWTPLSLAAVHGRMECVKVLLENGAKSIAVSKHDDETTAFSFRWILKNMFRQTITDWESLYSNAYSIALLQLFSLKSAVDNYTEKPKEAVPTGQGSVCRESGSADTTCADEVIKSLEGDWDQTSNEKRKSLQVKRSRNQQVLKQAHANSEILVKALGNTEAVTSAANKWVVFYLIKHITVYLLVLLSVSILALGRENLLTPDISNIRTVYESNLFDSKFPDQETNTYSVFSDIDQVEMFWNFIQGPFSSLLWPFDSDSGKIYFDSRVLGAVRFWQERRLLGPCPEKFGLIDNSQSTVISDDKLLCRLSEASMQSFGPNDTFYFDRISQGYIVDIPAGNTTMSKVMIQDLIDSEWVDSSTKSLKIMFTLFNPVQNAVTFFTLHLDSPVKNILIPSFDLTTIDWKSYSHGSNFLLAIDILLFMFCLWSTFSLFQTSFSTLKTLFNNKFAILRSLTVILCDMWYALRIACIILEQNTELSAGATSFIDLNTLSALTLIQRPFLSLAVLLVWLYSFRYLELTPALGPMIQAVTATLTHVRVTTFVVYLFFVCLCFGISCAVQFGSNVKAFAVPHEAMFNLFLGTFDLEEMQQSEYYFGTLAFFVLNVVLALTLVNIFIGLVGSIYDECYEKSEVVWHEEVNKLMTSELICNGLQITPYSDLSYDATCHHHDMKQWFPDIKEVHNSPYMILSFYVQYSG
jgi:Ca2+-binding EF-hand superfamily protein